MGFEAREWIVKGRRGIHNGKTGAGRLITKVSSV